MESKVTNRKKVLFIILILSVLFIAVYAGIQNTSYTAKAENGEFIQIIDNSHHKVLDDGEWQDCTVDNSDHFDLITSQLRRAIAEKETSAKLYIATSNPLYKDDAIQQIADIISGGVYSDDNAVVYDENGEFVGIVGSYMKEHMILDISDDDGSGYISSASSESKAFSYYKINFVMSYEDDFALGDDYVKEFVEEWQKEYIDSNKVISDARDDEKDFYIIKTIYNFIAKNTAYDFDVYQDMYPKESFRYRIAHTAFGALFGNTTAIQNANSISGNKSLSISFDKEVDSQGLYRPVNKDVGMSVCDGYAYLFYYMCHYNGIDCRVVKGDYTVDSGRGNDPHAWNMVKLGDKYYSVDVTFASQRSYKISNDFTIVNYDLFMRGTDDIAFSASNHQQAYKDYASIISQQSRDNYYFPIKSVYENDLKVFVSRRRTAASDSKDSSDGNYDIENYLIIDGENNQYKINDTKDGLVKADGFVYRSTGYYYSFDLIDYANGIEYICNDVHIVDAGDYDIKVNMADGKFLTKTVTIAPLDMGDIKSYNLGDTKINDNAIDRYIFGDDTITIEFAGVSINFTEVICDSSGKKLVKGKDYDIYCYAADDESREHITPKEPNDYKIRVEYYGNYSGYIEIPFTVTKADLSHYNINLNTTYGVDIASTINELKIGNNATGDVVTLYKGVDFDIVEIKGGLNYQDKGTVTVTGLPGSKYLLSNSKAVWTYTINTRYNAAALFDGKTIPNARYMYTGEEIKPSDFKLYYITDNGKRVDLEKDKDYKIVSYSNNVNPGSKATVKVEFIGNYTGTAVMHFEIVRYTVSVSNTVFEYNGKVQKPDVIIRDLNGTVQTPGKDYTLSYSDSNSKEVGTYTITIHYADSNLKPQVISYRIYKNADNISVSLSASSYTYNGKVQKPTVTVKDNNGKVLVSGTDYTLSYSNASSKSVGTYSVTVNLKGDYSGEIIKQYKINQAKFTLNVSDLTYNGKSQTPAVKVYVDKTLLKKGTDYTLSGSATNPGVYVVKATGKGIYTGVSASAVYYIKPSAVSGLKTSATYNSIKVSWSKQSNCVYQVYVYDSAKKSWKKLAQTSSTSYTIKKVYKNGKSVTPSANTNYSIKVRALYTVKVNGSTTTKYGDYKSITAFTLPKTPTISKVTKKNKNITATWKKDSAVSGYQVQISTNSKFSSGNKSATIKKNSTTSYTFKSLKKGKTYYVRVRSYKTYNKKNYYSAYSKVYKIKL